jgi:hypothetical protein
MREPNNLRNRYRRYRATRQAYKFYYLPFRDWALGPGRNPDSYSVAHVDSIDRLWRQA